MTTRRRLARLENVLPQARPTEEPPATWASLGAGWRGMLENIVKGDVGAALLSRVDEIGRRPGPAPGEAPATNALLVLACPEARRVATQIIAVLSNA